MSNELIQLNENNNLENQSTLTIDKLKSQIKLVNELLNEVLQSNVHYGIIPGCGDKPTLLKAGAEKLCTLFRLAPNYDVFVLNFDEGHREYRVTTTLRHIKTNDLWGGGIGSCSTLESKYRYKSHRERQDIADMYNTVLKMAKKRSLVDAILTATAASDIFTQDIEDIIENKKALSETETETLHKNVDKKFDELQEVHMSAIANCVDYINTSEDWASIEKNYTQNVDKFKNSKSLSDKAIKCAIDILETAYKKRMINFPILKTV